MYLLPLLFLMMSCNFAEPMKEPSPQGRPKRYSVTQDKPLVLFNDIIAMVGQTSYLPSLAFLTNNGEIYQDDNIRYLTNDFLDEANRRMGHGPSYVFNKIDKKKSENRDWITKGSVQLLYADNKVKRDYNLLLNEDFTDRIELSYSMDYVKCEINGRSHLSCWLLSEGYPAAKKTLWDQPQNPIVELSPHTYPGIYFVTQDGRLWHFKRNYELTDVENVNKDIRFIKNSQGRYFINAPSNHMCLQSEQLSIYCFEHNELGKFLEAEIYVHPHLKKVLDIDFKVDEITYSGRHFCLLSPQGEVFCQGDNSCGQITGRYDGVQKFTSLQKVDFLEGPAKQLFAYQGGTCVLLKNGSMQCFGLGASVKRSKILELGNYYESFAFAHGFRPKQICGGGAEYGI